jgi:aminoglycoside phosphotransferase family enzyme/predicted kinase
MRLMSALIQALLDPRCYPHPVVSVHLIETHISWLLLTGTYAYKIKKPLALDFLDFGTLERRLHYCREELRLNRRFAPQIYLSVVAIAGDEHHPKVEGPGEALEYAVKMREFGQACLLDRRLEAGMLGADDIDALADTCARIHDDAPVAASADAFGSPQMLLQPALANFDSIERSLGPKAVRMDAGRLRSWTQSEHARLEATFAARKSQGRIRECHGDLHLRNIALIDGAPVLFDCIEFDDALRWIDVMSEMAFVVMDLHARGRPDLGWRLLNRYFEAGGDYDGVQVLRFYLVYRALVRAKIDCIRAAQAGSDDSAQWHDFDRRIALANRFAATGRPFLAITCGVSGSGKTHASQLALERTGAIRVRSDVERKRLAEIAPRGRSGSGVDAGIYSRQASDRTFARLAELARTIVNAGYPAIVDATFIERGRREPFRNLAKALHVPFVVLHCTAPHNILAQRIERRLASGSDASEADLDVLQRQQQRKQTVEPAECSELIDIDSDDPASVAVAVERLACIARVDAA